MRYAILLYFILMISSCQQRYWYRNKFDLFSPKPRKKVALVINNQAEDWLDERFEDLIKKKCEQIFKRKKLDIAQIDSLADFTFYLNVAIDSFNVSGDADYMDRYHNYGLYSYKRSNVKAIMFDYKMERHKGKIIEWQENNDIYYYDDYRDLGRCVGMVRYTIKRKQNRP